MTDGILASIKSDLLRCRPRSVRGVRCIAADIEPPRAPASLQPAFRFIFAPSASPAGSRTSGSACRVHAAQD
jgi:hypothetical protein